MTPHNPDNLTPEQIGTADGWRLLDVDEITESSSFSISEIQCYLSSEWDADWMGNTLDHTYRFKGTREELAAKRGITVKQNEPTVKELNRTLLTEALGLSKETAEIVMDKIEALVKEIASEQAMKGYLADRVVKLTENELLLNRQIDEYRESSQHWQREWKKASDRIRDLETELKAVDESRSEESEKLMQVFHWINSNHPDGFIDSQTYAQNLGRVNERHFARLWTVEEKLALSQQENVKLQRNLEGTEKYVKHMQERVKENEREYDYRADYLGRLEEKIQTLTVHLRDANKGCVVLRKRLEIRFAANNEDLDVLKKELKVAHDRIDWLSQQREVECKEKEHALKAEEECNTKLLAAQADNVRLRGALDKIQTDVEHPYTKDDSIVCPFCAIIEPALETTIDTGVIEKVIEALELSQYVYNEMSSTGWDENSDWQHSSYADAEDANIEALALLKGEK